MAEEPAGAGDPGLVAYVEAVASAAPTPGGGSVAAVVGTLAAALGEMVVNLTAGRSDAAAFEEEMRLALGRLGDLRRRLLALAVEDERAYGAYRAAAALPKGTPDEKTARTAAMQTALLRSADVPLNVAATCVNLFPDLGRVARLGNKHVLSDAEVAAILADAAVRAAAVNVRVNAGLIRDRAHAAHLLARAAEAEDAARAGAARVSAAVADRTE